MNQKKDIKKVVKSPKLKSKNLSIQPTIPINANLINVKVNQNINTNNQSINNNFNNEKTQEKNFTNKKMKPARNKLSIVSNNNNNPKLNNNVNYIKINNTSSNKKARKSIVCQNTSLHLNDTDINGNNANNHQINNTNKPNKNIKKLINVNCNSIKNLVCLKDLSYHSITDNEPNQNKVQKLKEIRKQILFTKEENKHNINRDKSCGKNSEKFYDKNINISREKYIEKSYDNNLFDQEDDEDIFIDNNLNNNNYTNYLKNNNKTKQKIINNYNNEEKNDKNINNISTNKKLIKENKDSKSMQNFSRIINSNKSNAKSKNKNVKDLSLSYKICNNLSQSSKNFLNNYQNNLRNIKSNNDESTRESSQKNKSPLFHNLYIYNFNCMNKNSYYNGKKKIISINNNIKENMEKTMKSVLDTSEIIEVNNINISNANISNSNINNISNSRPEEINHQSTTTRCIVGKKTISKIKKVYMNEMHNNNNHDTLNNNNGTNNKSDNRDASNYHNNSKNKNNNININSHFHNYSNNINENRKSLNKTLNKNDATNINIIERNNIGTDCHSNTNSNISPNPSNSHNYNRNVNTAHPNNINNPNNTNIRNPNTNNSISVNANNNIHNNSSNNTPSTNPINVNINKRYSLFLEKKLQTQKEEENEFFDYDENDGLNDKDELTKEEKNIYGNREMKDYKKIKLLGKGGCGIVWLCMNVNTHQICAVKQISKKNNPLLINSNLQIARNEIEMLKFINNKSIEKEKQENDEDEENSNYSEEKCPFIVDIYNSYEDQNDIWFSFEKGGKSLSSLSFKVKGEFLKNERIYTIKKGKFLKCLFDDIKHFKTLIKYLLIGIEYINKKGIIHSDIKPENILIEYENLENENFQIKSVKIIDFGSSFFAKNFKSISSNTPEYLCPELTDICEDKNKQNKQNFVNEIENYISCVDIWSLGVTILELVLFCPVWMSYKAKIFMNGKSRIKTGLFGFKCRDGNKIKNKQIEVCNDLHKILIQSAVFKFKKEDKTNFEDFISKMLCLDFKNRITPSDALNHNFLKEVMDEQSD